MKKESPYKRLDPELLKEITRYVIDCLHEEEAKIVKVNHDRKRSNIKLLLRKNREIVKHVDESVYEAAHLSEDVLLQDLFEQMVGTGKENFRVEAIKESAAKSRVMVDHMNKMLESYRLSCESSGKDEDRRRYRVIYSVYISPEVKTMEEIADDEFVDKSTIYRDIDAAADKLAVLFFGVYGLRFL
jgi:hypothetical protein